MPGAELTLKNLTVADGLAPIGSGLLNDGGTVEVTNSTFSGNSATGAATNGGGGILNFGSASSGNGVLTVTNSTFSGNSAVRPGGGIRNTETGTLTVTNSTFSGNSTASEGSTVPRGGAIDATGTVSATLSNTIVANTTQGSNCFGAITDGGYNIDDGTTCGFSATNNSQRSTDPLLNSSGLQNNGGPTKTIALQPTSPAVDKGKSFGATTDQRGKPRPHDLDNVANATGGDGSDIGAFELETPVFQTPVLAIDDVTVTEGNSGTTTATFTVRLSEASALTVTVNYATVDGTATAGTDYQPASGTLTFAPGEMSKSVTVLVNGDIVDEEGETFFVNLSSPTNATISDTQGEGTITDNDPPPDTTAPTTTVALNPAIPNGLNGWYTSAVHLTVSATDGSGSGVAETRCALDPASEPASFDDLPSSRCPYLDSGASVSSDGQHTLYAASKDDAGNDETPQNTSFKIDTTKPTVSCDAVSPGPTFVLGGTGGSVSATVTDATSEPINTSLSGAANVSSVGNKSISLTGTDRAGNTTTVGCPYRVKYNFSRFLSPIPQSSYKAGSTIPVKFTLTNAAGTRISDADAQVLVANSCKVKVFFSGGTPAKNCAAYNATTDTFQFDLKISKSLTSGLYTVSVEVSAPDGSGLVNKETIQVTIRR
jgi:Calx-beta domain